MKPLQGRPSPATRVLRPLLMFALLALSSPAAFAYNQNRVATDARGQPIRISGSVVIVDPDIELSEMLAGGVQEPRREWSIAARRLYPAAVHAELSAAGTRQVPDYDVPDDLPADSPMGQILRLNEAVSISIVAYTSPGNQLATKPGKRLDWTLGPGVETLRKASGADYALFTYMRDSYTSSGRKALRVAALLLLGGDIGGGRQLGVTTLVDLRTGRVVWFNFLSNQTGDLRDSVGASATAQKMLKGLPL